MGILFHSFARYRLLGALFFRMGVCGLGLADGTFLAMVQLGASSLPCLES